MPCGRNSVLEPRLYVQVDLREGEFISLPKQSHYLRNVMRLSDGDYIRVFNGIDGEWLASLLSSGKRAFKAKILHKIKEQAAETRLKLFPAVLKRAYFDFLVMKSTEIGVTDITPCFTSRTQIREINIKHSRSISIEAAEQSERLSIPDIHQPIALKNIEKVWENGCIPIICAEFGKALPIVEALLSIKDQKSSSIAIITGPEGGYSVEEMELLLSLPKAVPVRLGPRIIRAETAAIAALACYQAVMGDWSGFHHSSPPLNHPLENLSRSSSI